MKSLFPRWMKWLPWFLFKSPQRKTGILSSWMTELRGALSFIPYIYSNAPLRPVSICTGIKNRTDNYLHFILESVLKMENPDLIELSIYDCGSEDVEALKQSILEKWTGNLVFHSEDHPFERSYSFNKAILQSSNELFFAADADMQLPTDLVAQCNKYVRSNTVWFPVCFNLKENKPAIISPENGNWRHEGKGMFGATKKQFLLAGKYDEKYKTWGLEDWDLWLKFYQKGIYPIRTRSKGLFHHWHPPVAEANRK